MRNLCPTRRMSWRGFVTISPHRYFLIAIFVALFIVHGNFIRMFQNTLPTLWKGSFENRRTFFGALRLVSDGSTPLGLQRMQGNRVARAMGEIPPARVSVFFEDSFSKKRFQRDGGVAGFPNTLRNRYRLFERWDCYEFVTLIFFFFLANFGGRWKSNRRRFV
jgi:hypothetical protein